MTKQLTPLRQKDIEVGRQLERKEIVEWLRNQHGLTTQLIAIMIEKEQHKCHSSQSTT